MEVYYMTDIEHAPFSLDERMSASLLSAPLYNSQFLDWDESLWRAEHGAGNSTRPECQDCVSGSSDACRYILTYRITVGL